MKYVEIYTDGACSGNPGPGGWGAILVYGEHEKEISGFGGETTNNRMEIIAAIQALSLLKEPCRVDLYTDSAYLCHAFTQHWLESWQRKGWQRDGNKPVINRDLWELLLEQTKKHTITWHLVKGHADNARNNRCDVLARKAIAQGIAPAEQQDA